MTAIPLHPTPPPKIPAEVADIKAPRTQEEQIDKQMKDFFPASDPPSYSGGNHAIGAPTGRESESPKSDAHEVASAEKKVKSGNVKTDKY